MSRCQHGQRISIFCVNEECTWRQAGGCEKCFKKYHDHLISQHTLNELELDTIFKKTVLKSDVKVKSRPLAQALYNYFMIMKSQISSSIDAVSRGIINKISHPYMFREGQLSTYKKIKNKEYKKITKKELISYYQFSNRLSLEEFQKEQKNLYLEETENIMNVINEINHSFAGYAKAVINFDSTFNMEQSFYQKIQQISAAILQNKQQSTVGDNQPFQNIVIPEIRTNQVQRPETKAQTIKPKETDFLGVQKPQNRERKVSIDVSHNYETHRYSPSVNYDENEKKILNEKRKLLDLLDTSKKKRDQKPMETSIYKAVQKETPPKIDPFISRFLEAKQQQKPERLDNQSNKSKQSSNKEFRDHQSKSSDDHPFDVLGDLISKGINIPEMIIHTILPRVDSKKKLYEHTEEVKEKKIVIPVRQFEGPDQISSPILKKRKKNKEVNFDLKKVDSELEKQEKKSSQLSQKDEEKLDLKEKQANSLALLVQSLPLPAQKAIPLLETALKYAHNNLSAAQYLSYLYLQIGKPKLCLDLCNQILQQMEDSPQYNELAIHISNNKAAALNILGRYSESISILQRCIEYEKKDIFFKNLADAYYSIGIYEKAIYNYENAVRLNTHLDEAYYNMGVCLYLQENYTSSQLSVHRALQLSPDNQNYIELKQELKKKISF